MLRRICVCLILLTLCSFTQDLYIYHGNVFDKLFRDTNERFYVIFGDWTLLEFTSYENDRVRGHVDIVISQIERVGKTLDNVIIMVHNHFGSPKLSGKDIQVARQFIDMGYNGVFAVYDTASGSLVTYRK